MPKKQIERRTVPCEFRVSSDTGKSTIFGYAAKFGVRSEDLGGWVEVIAPDAFDLSLASNPDIRGLVNHDPNLILGRTKAGTMTVRTDEVGLAYEIQPPDTSYAKDLMVSMQRGDINQSSFGFIARDTSWGYDEVTGLDVRTVKQAELFDCSPVTFPAYPDATSGLRSLPSDMPMEVRSKLKLAKRSSDDGEPNENGCECECPECQNNDCENCSDPDCTDENCLANQESRSLRAADERRRLAIRLGFAEMSLSEDASRISGALNGA